MPRSDRYPIRLLPSKELRRAWRDSARADGSSGSDVRAYEVRWLTLWKRTLDVVREHDTWNEDQLWLIQDFVEARRLAYEHQLEADSEGRFQRNGDSGRYFAHPALDKARDARRDARDIAADLLMTPKALRD